jgi:calcineurin-like phosphoesterase family protein
MKTFLISDTHLNHANIATYCDRPSNFTDLIIKRWNERVTIHDTVIHLGDVAIGHLSLVESQIRSLNGTKILIRGNHDRAKSNSWWMDHGFSFACDGMRFGNCWLTHEPDTSRAGGCDLNIHGHLHNIWHGFNSDVKPSTVQEAEWQRLKHQLKHDWQRLFAIEYTDYYPIEIQEFINHPDKYLARGVNLDNKKVFDRYNRKVYHCGHPVEPTLLECPICEKAMVSARKLSKYII